MQKTKTQRDFDHKMLASFLNLTSCRNFVTGKFTDFPVCVIRDIFIRKLSHLTISSPFILINQKNA